MDFPIKAWFNFNYLTPNLNHFWFSASTLWLESKTFSARVPRDEMPAFDLGSDVHANVKALRRALGSVTREISQSDLAALVRDRHPDGRAISGSQIGRWENDIEPDFGSTQVMADLAGVSFEQFALGKRAEKDARPGYQRVAEQHGLKVAEGSDPYAALEGKKKKAAAAKKRPA